MEMDVPTAQEWNRRSMDKILEMGGTSIGGNFAWIDIERDQGVCMATTSK